VITIEDIRVAVRGEVQAQNKAVTFRLDRIEENLNPTPYSPVSDSVFCQMIENTQILRISEAPMEEGGGSVLSHSVYEELNSGTMDEHDLIARVTPELFNICVDAGFILGNSEDNAWIRVEHGSRLNDEKPDLFIGFPGLYEETSPHRQQLLQHLRTPTASFIFGKPIWAIKDMYFIMEFKVKSKRADRGTLYKYLKNLSSGDKITRYYGILADKIGFTYSTCYNGNFSHPITNDWRSPGSRSFLVSKIQEFTETSRWVSLLQKLCQMLKVTVLGYIGCGNHGRCFKVMNFVTRAEFVLKIVLTGHLINKDAEAAYAATQHEYKTLAEKPHRNLVKVQPNSLKVVLTSPTDTLGLGYLMVDVGSAVSISNLETSQKLFELFESLRELHHAKIFHGDARIANVILRDGQFVWIDLMLSSSFDETISKSKDIWKLIQSLFGSATSDDARLQELVDEYGSFSDSGNIAAITEYLWTILDTTR